MSRDELPAWQKTYCLDGILWAVQCLSVFETAGRARVYIYRRTSGAKGQEVLVVARAHHSSLAQLHLASHGYAIALTREEYAL